TDPTAPTISADGKTVSNDGKTLVVATEDGRTLTLKLNPQTKFMRSGNSIEPNKIVPRTTVHVQAAEDDEAYLTAMQVELVKDAPQEAAEAQTRGDSGNGSGQADADRVRPTILDNPVEAPDRPILRRG